MIVDYIITSNDDSHKHCTAGKQPMLFFLSIKSQYSENILVAVMNLGQVVMFHFSSGPQGPISLIFCFSNQR